MSKTYYHATSKENALSIIRDGVIKPSMEGIVYCCTSMEDCLKFIILRATEGQSIVVFKIDVPDNVEVTETFDHSERFFKCKSYGICSKVPMSWIDVAGSKECTFNYTGQEGSRA